MVIGFRSGGMGKVTGGYPPFLSCYAAATESWHDHETRRSLQFSTVRSPDRYMGDVESAAEIGTLTPSIPLPSSIGR